MKQAAAIAVFGYYGVGNLGDEAVVATLIRNIRARRPGARVVGISLNPDDTRVRHGIDALPIRRMYMPDAEAGRTRLPGLRRMIDACKKLGAEVLFTVSSLRALRAIDMVVVAGSGGVYDWWHGAWTHPFTHFRWALLCRFTQTRLAYVSVGAGPFKTPLGRLFFRTALSIAAYRSFRDEESIAWMNRIGVHKRAQCVPDMAFDIAPAAPRRRGHARGARALRVGVNAIPFYHDVWSALLEDRDGIGYDGYVETLAHFVSWLIERGCTPVFFHSQIGDAFLDADIAASVDAIRNGAQWRSCTRFIEPQTPDALLEEIASLDVVVASRFHAVLFSFLTRTPVLAVSYHHKIDDLMEKMGRGADCLDIRTLTCARLQASFARLEDEVMADAWSIDDRLCTEYRQQLQQQFDDLFIHHERH